MKNTHRTAISLTAAALAACTLSPTAASAADAPLQGRIVSHLDGSHLGVRYDGVDPYRTVDSFPRSNWNDYTSVRWRITGHRGGWLTIKNVKMNLCLQPDGEVKNGTQLKVADCAGGEQQRWMYYTAGGSLARGTTASLTPAANHDLALTQTSIVAPNGGTGGAYIQPSLEPRENSVNQEWSLAAR